MRALRRGRFRCGRCGRGVARWRICPSHQRRMPIRRRARRLERSLARLEVLCRRRCRTRVPCAWTCWCLRDGKARRQTGDRLRKVLPPPNPDFGPKRDTRAEIVTTSSPWWQSQPVAAAGAASTLPANRNPRQNSPIPQATRTARRSHRSVMTQPPPARREQRECSRGVSSRGPGSKRSAASRPAPGGGLPCWSAHYREGL